MDILETLKTRFNHHLLRHKGVNWDDVASKIAAQNLLDAIQYMEETGGEPDVVYDESRGLLMICDCAKESPIGRRSLCYDEKARLSRKKNAPISSAAEEAAKHALSLIDLDTYNFLQSLEEFDLSSSSWIATPEDIRLKGGAIFCEKKYGHVFYFHNGADSYYSNRGWRGLVLLR